MLFEFRLQRTFPKGTVENVKDINFQILRRKRYYKRELISPWDKRNLIRPFYFQKVNSNPNINHIRDSILSPYLITKN